LTAPALQQLALLVRGADTDARDLTPESAGLYAIAGGFRLVYQDDHEQLEREWPVYDALYAVCRQRVEREAASSGAAVEGNRMGVARRTILFLCPHGAAKSVIAAAYCRRLAEQRGIDLAVACAGTEPDRELAPAVVAALRARGLDLVEQQPRRVEPAELASAWRVVSLGCDPAALGAAAGALDRWDDVPSPSQDIAAACAAIAARVMRLLEELDEDERRSAGG
ncbi:MAG: chromate resistance protein ChrB domain-containing protein, partial [Dehalococcoidia bacterium]